MINPRKLLKFASLSLAIFLLTSNHYRCAAKAEAHSSNQDQLEPSSEFRVNSIYNNEESSTEILEEELEDEKEDDLNTRTFSWRNHPDDHGVYSGRSLLSTENIKRKDEGTESEEYSYGEVKITNRNKTKRRNYDDDDLDPLKTVDYVEKEWQLMFRSFDLAYETMSSTILQQINQQTNIFDEVISRLQPECRRSIDHVRESVKKHRLWALRMVDSNGRLPSGVSYGRFSSPGDYEECLSVRVDERVYLSSPAEMAQSEHHKFHGKYCLLDFRLPLPDRPHDRLLSVHEPVLNLTDTDLVRDFPELRNYSAYASVFYDVGYMHAFCLPSSCNVTDLTQSLGHALEGLHVIVNNTVDCEERPPDEARPLRRSQVIALCLLILLFLNAICASFAHHLLPEQIKNQTDHGPPVAPPNLSSSSSATSPAQGSSKLNHLKESQSKSESASWSSKLWERLVKASSRNKFYSNCFSIQKNFERLAKPDPRGMTFVHYTRIVAMALTVVTHTGAMGTLQAITKPADASNSEQIFRDLLPQMLANAFTSIQIFFFMAGFMLVVSTFPSIKREKGHVSFLEYVTKRAIRLMPGLAATICLNFLWPLLVDGPMLTYFTRMIVVPCEVNWWRTLGFMSNFDHAEKICLRHSYFSASDYQLHVMAFPLLLLLYKQPSLSLILAGLITLAGFVAQVIMILTKVVLPFMTVDYLDKEAFINVVHYIHHPVWNHMSAFFYGFIIGYLVVRQIRINLSDTTIKRIWLVMMPAGIASIFAPYFWNHYRRPLYKWQMVLYVIFDRLILLSTCAWLSYATMVLARKPRAKRPAAVVGLNLTAGKEQKQQEQQKADEKGSESNIDGETVSQNQELPQIKIGGGPLESDRGHLRAGNLHLGIPRQRSSPIFDNLPESQDSPPRLSKATSSMNLAQVGVNIAEVTVDKMWAESGGAEGQDAQRVEAGSCGAQGGNKPPKGSVPVSNMNTLCLILSRLTFQLYLFNMVVLWVDVNHSKYYWFFSYYFIIIKAAAVYIASSIMAMIFFVTLESPCLTLYIAWVKNRAFARAQRRSGNVANEQSTDKEGPVHRTNIEPNNRSKSAGAGGRSQLGDSFDGLCMRMATPDPGSKSTFSYIDLSTSSAPTTTSHRSLCDDQTRI